MTKVFISQPTRDRDNDDIEYERNRIRSKVGDLFADAVIIDSFFDFGELEVKNEPLYYLGESLCCMSEADLVVFALNWETARGCIIEHECAEKYGIEILYYKDLINNN